ncbi:Smr/MutS family endonuclease [Acinetobacter sp. A3.8]|uniref:Smr/MutS family endonuclease n=1 Tax=Acinetobacter sedimenti TaxID=2919922 RepID=A0A9X1WVF4_9GAMM|nr:Smr/MutS family protein [Acinetobacter sedimenti]MCJ8145924.1 Smr/MutS family endonuclease [Acinetobacter sedimenti]
MSKHDTSLSKSQLDLLKQFKKQIHNDSDRTDSHAQTKSKAQKNNSADTQTIEDESLLFSKAMQGVEKIKDHNIAQTEKTTKQKKVDAQTLAKRMAAEGSEIAEGEALSDMQALLNPVASQAFLSYRITTLQHRIFEDLKAGKMRWFEAVDLHGCTIEQARRAVLELLQIAKENNQNVVKIVHGKGKDGVLKTCVNGWLRQHREVLAFVSVPENQGGTGAVLVLLKRAEKNPKYDAQK